MVVRWGRSESAVVVVGMCDRRDEDEDEDVGVLVV